MRTKGCQQGVRDNLFKVDNGDNDNIKEGNDDLDDDDDDDHHHHHHQHHHDTFELHHICCGCL